MPPYQAIEARQAFLYSQTELSRVLSGAASSLWQPFAVFVEQLNLGDATDGDSHCEPSSRKVRVRFTNRIAQRVLSDHDHACCWM